MIGLAEIRAIAMALPQVEEGPPVRAAHRIASFKVAGKSFVGVETGARSMTVSLAENEARALTAEHPKAYEEIWRNGKIFMGLRVDLSAIPDHRVRELIERSWRHSAPSPLRRQQPLIQDHRDQADTQKPPQSTQNPTMPRHCATNSSSSDSGLAKAFSG